MNNKTDINGPGRPLQVATAAFLVVGLALAWVLVVADRLLVAWVLALVVVLIEVEPRLDEEDVDGLVTNWKEPRVVGDPKFGSPANALKVATGWKRAIVRGSME